MNKIFTSESVTSGHPDKLCDIISDSILDDILKNDEHSRVACETLATRGLIVVAGQISSHYSPDIQHIVKNVVKNIGYTTEECGFDFNSSAVISMVDKQSPDISQGVDNSYEFTHFGKDNIYNKMGAGDQGTIFGFACDETKDLMPAPIYYAHKLAQRLEFVRTHNICNFLLPDGKTQVSFEYDELGNPVFINSIVVSCQHRDIISQSELHQSIKSNVIDNIIPANLISDKTKIFINPTGRFVTGGVAGDVGLTGRKIEVDTYGGYVPHGGGAFSGKDATKVDRCAAYMARYAAKNIVAAKLAKKCLVQVSYAIGVANPVSLYVNSYGTGVVSDNEILNIISKTFDFRPAAIIDNFNLKKPIYSQLSAYGHFGRSELNLAWEQTNRVDIIKKYIG